MAERELDLEIILMSYRAWFQCINPACEATYPLNSIVYSCGRCGSLLEVQHDTAALARLMRTHLGKTILFTDNADWTSEEIVLGYRAQDHIESAFRDMKNPHFLGWSPMFHWTDSKIQVHAFYCVLALILGSLLQRQAAQKGLPLSMPALFQTLSGIQEVANIYPATGKPGSPGRPSVKITLTEMDSTQQALYRLWDLDRYRRS